MARIAQQDAKSYLLSGKAFVTVHNTQPRPGRPAQYQFVIRKKAGVHPKGLWYVYTGDVYLGFITYDRFNPDTSLRAELLQRQRLKAFVQVWEWITTQTLPDTIHLLHAGVCGHCGRKLTDAISIKTGIGPECRKKLGIIITKSPTHELDPSQDRALTVPVDAAQRPHQGNVQAPVSANH
jgi:hypothetical protein